MDHLWDCGSAHLVTGASDDGGEDSPGGVVSCEAGLAHAGAIVDDQCRNVFVTHGGVCLCDDGQALNWSRRESVWDWGGFGQGPLYRLGWPATACWGQRGWEEGAACPCLPRQPALGHKIAAADQAWFCPLPSHSLLLDSGSKVYTTMEISQTPLFNESLHNFVEMNGNGNELKKDSWGAASNAWPVLTRIFLTPNGGEGGLACVSLYGLALNIETLPSQPGMPFVPNVQQAVYRHIDHW